VRNTVGPGEVSAAGTPGETGVILLCGPKTSDVAKAGLFAGDILLAFNGKPVRELRDLLKVTRQVVAGTAVKRNRTAISTGVYGHDPPETLTSLLITLELTIICGDILRNRGKKSRIFAILS